MPNLTWTNPIIDAAGADPFILNAEGKYWLYATGKAKDGRHIPIWSSVDLVEWQYEAHAVANGGEGAWNQFNFWAPEVLHYDNRYWIYYSAKHTKDDKNHSNRLGVAVSDTPAGPFEDLGPLIDHAALDGSPFLDDDGQLWMYYVTEHGSSRGHAPGKIWVDKMLDPQTVADEAVCLIDQHNWQEGPVVFKQTDGRYRLTFSLGGWTGDTYRVAQAVADNPAGPFTESDALIMKTTDAVKGPGHHNFFTGPDGERWVIYHGWDPAMTTRYPRIDRLRYTDDGTVSSDAPTCTEQTHSW